MTTSHLFTRTYQQAPAGLWSAPGRVNLIGEHTDYNNGLVMPFAIDARAHVAISRSVGRRVKVVSAQRDSLLHDFHLDELTPDGPAAQGWAAYVFGAVWALREAGHPVDGINIALDSSVPVGAGLSSSAALECAVTLGVSQLMGVKLAPREVAIIAQSAENNFVGVPCGLMDQMASSACKAGNVLFFDVDAETTEQVPFNPGAHGYAILVIDTHVHHELADGEYGKRRDSCEEAAAELEVASLREITLEGLETALGTLSNDLLRKRTRHVVTENGRVANAVGLLRAQNLGGLGDLMVASHVSLRDDYEVSDPALDLAVDTAMSAGAVGARMTGGGFGGSAIALVEVGAVDRVTGAIERAFTAAGRREPTVRSVRPSEGARRDG